jgi:hypothetical protein
MMSHQPAMDNTTAAEEEEESMCTTNDMFYSPAEKDNLLHMQKEFDIEFPVGSVFSTRSHHIAAMRQKATKFGFFVIDRGMAACCSETTSRDVANAKKSSPGNWFPRKMGKPTYQENLQGQSEDVTSRLTSLQS